MISQRPAMKIIQDTFISESPIGENRIAFTVNKLKLSSSGSSISLVDQSKVLRFGPGDNQLNFTKPNIIKKDDDSFTIRQRN